jgi:asparagine synthase (glutamine-hydrolysing)
MCGIAVLVRSAGLASPGAIVPMTRLVRHRGPDDEGFATFARGGLAPRLYSGETGSPPGGGPEGGGPGADAIASDTSQVVAAFGHRRLSIVGLGAGGHQPMGLDDGSVWIVFNGEIYNFPEIREELAATGHRFSSETDTEVLLAAYRQWGTACLDRFNGMFAFVLLDRERGVVFAARDRFGVKPLYYWIAPDSTIAFASEIKQFTVLPGWRARLNGQRGYDFLEWGLIDNTDETLFSGVFQLPGGHFLELPVASQGSLARPASPAPAPGGRLASSCWYRLQARRFEGDEAAAWAEFHRIFEASIALRLRADVPVGSCLSGGLDSSAIVCVMSRLLASHGMRAHTFSAAAHESKFDESHFARMVLEATGAHGTFVYPDAASLFSLLDRLVWHQDEPFGSTSILAQWHVFSDAAAASVKVMLDGQGADEQLAGYHSFFAPRLATLFRQARLRELAAEVRALRSVHGHSVPWIAGRALDGLLPYGPRQRLRRLAGKPSASTPVDVDLLRLGAQAQDPFARALAIHGDRTLAGLSRAQILSTSVPMLLHFEDRNSMAHSVEARVPFLDYRLVEFALGLPDEFKLREGTTKRVLRGAMKGILPEPVRSRQDKMGFLTPEEVWLRRGAPEQFRAATREAVSHSHGVLLPFAQDTLERVIRGDEPFSFKPWRRISFGAWMKVFNVTPE